MHSSFGGAGPISESRLEWGARDQRWMWILLFDLGPSCALRSSSQSRERISGPRLNFDPVRLALWNEVMGRWLVNWDKIISFNPLSRAGFKHLSFDCTWCRYDWRAVMASACSSIFDIGPVGPSWIVIWWVRKPISLLILLVGWEPEEVFFFDSKFIMKLCDGFRFFRWIGWGVYWVMVWRAPRFILVVASITGLA